MKYSIILLFCLVVQFSFAQPAAEALQGNFSLRERYGLLKSKSQTFKDYKVIKETVLDGFWKIVMDSVSTSRSALAGAHKQIDSLRRNVAETNKLMKEKEESVAGIVFDSTHITVAGISFHKGVFLGGVAIVLGALIFFLVSGFARMKVVSHSLQERKLAVTTITNEYEEYKRKAMEKQMKLSRELQDERNKLQAFRSMNG